MTESILNPVAQAEKALADQNNIDYPALAKASAHIENMLSKHMYLADSLLQIATYLAQDATYIPHAFFAALTVATKAPLGSDLAQKAMGIWKNILEKTRELPEENGPPVPSKKDAANFVKTHTL
jgi:hypothetical protein